MCKTGVETSTTNALQTPTMLRHYLKDLLHDEFVAHLQNQIQQNKAECKTSTSIHFQLKQGGIKIFLTVTECKHCDLNEIGNERTALPNFM